MDNKLSPDLEERSSRHLSVDYPNRHRSSSNAPSERSGITLVADDKKTIKRFQSELKTFAPSESQSKLRILGDRMLGLFCMKTSSETGKVDMKSSSSSRKPTSADEEEDDDKNPWVLQVCVQSTQKEDAEHFMPKWARCTFDTGNQQGNIVSKDFLLQVLGWSESSFLPLNKSEMVPGVGITGHELKPEGAVHLTWYYEKSTRVFHNMRFLISPHAHYDLVVGARSILKHNLIGVPNLMSGVPKETLLVFHDVHDLSILLKAEAQLDEERLKLIEQQSKQKSPNKELDDKVARARLLHKIAGWRSTLYEQKKKPQNQKTKETIKTIEKDLKNEGDSLTVEERVKLRIIADPKAKPNKT